MTPARTSRIRSWDVVVIESEDISVTVVPGKGGDILSIVRRIDNLDVLWRSPWGLREKGAASGGGGSVPQLMEHYPGGWQTVFPNGGDACIEEGVEWGMHGEVWLAPFDVTGSTAGAIEMQTRLVRSPFEVVKRITVEGPTVVVNEWITNRGGHPVEVMWSHHPAFGPPLLGPDCRLHASARRVVVDDVRDTPSSDLIRGVTARWPWVPARSGGEVDLRLIPPPAALVDRFAYLTDFDEGLLSLANPKEMIGVELRWDLSAMPNAWYWLETHGSRGFPWYGQAYVLGLEPATSYPGQGIVAARSKTGTQVAVQPGQTRNTRLALTLTSGDA